MAGAAQAGAVASAEAAGAVPEATVMNTLPTVAAAAPPPWVAAVAAVCLVVVTVGRHALKLEACVLGSLGMLI